MTEREKVIQGLEVCTAHGTMCGDDCSGYFKFTNDFNIERVNNYKWQCPYAKCETGCAVTLARDALALLKEQEFADKYEYHYDHTDCIWYDGTYHNPCPSTCSQYRDGWNDAMNYIFKGGKGYQPYKRR